MAKKKKVQKKPPIGKNIVVSTIIHLALITLVMLFPPHGFINPKPPVDITWVELPKGTGDDIYGLKDVKRLPETTIQEQQKIPEPLKPLPKDEVQPEDKKMPEPVVKKEKPKVRKSISVSGVKKSTKRKSTNRSSALSKIDKRLKNRREAAQVPSSGEGFRYGTSDKPVRIPIDDPEYLKYQALVRGRIMGRWVVPNGVPTGDYRMRIIVYISQGGDVISKRWAKRSTIEMLNSSAMRAIERASPFPIPPERMKWETYNEGFLIEFSAR